MKRLMINAVVSNTENPNMTATIKRIVTLWTVPAIVLIAGGFVCDGLTEVGHDRWRWWWWSMPGQIMNY